MIRLIDIRLNAAHPELKLPEAVTYTGAPSTALIRGVPPNYGRWAITAVSVAATFPDGSTTTRTAVQSANGVWVATLPATATSGRTTDGFRVIADGIDENGEAATGYILAVADFAVASLAVTPAPEPGETSYQMLYFDEAPSVLRKGDVTKIDGVLKFYNGSAWESFAASGTLDDAVTRTSANGVKSSGIWAAIWGALTALPAGFTSLYDWVADQLAGKRDYGDRSWISQVNGKPTAENGGWFTVNGIKFSYDEDSGKWLPPDGQMEEASIAPNEESSPTRYNIYLPSSSPGVGMEAYFDWKNTDTNKFEYVIPGPDNVDYTVTEHIPFVDSFALESAVETALAGKLSTSGGTMQGDLNINGRDINITSAGRVIVRGLNGYVAVFANDGIDFSTDDAMSWTHFDWPSASGTLALTSAIPYKLVTKTITNGAVTLDDRAINAVAVSSSLASLTVNFPAATSGKARDFGVRLTVASGVTTAPQLVLPQGVTCENADGTAPEIGADGAATILYFTETAAGVFLVKGETVQTIS